MKLHTVFPKIFLGMMILLLSLLVGCQRDKSPLGMFPNIDPKVVGDWYHVDVNTSPGTPPFSIHGIRILENGEVKILAVETETGKLALLDTASRGKFYYIIDGTLDFKSYRFGFTFPAPFHSPYQLKGEILLIANGDQHYLFASTFQRSAVGRVVTTPVISHFMMVVNDEVMYNSPIGRRPSAFASYYEFADHNQLRIQTTSGNHNLTISLDDFTGVDSYLIGTEESGDASYSIWSGDIAIVYGVTKPTAGSVVVEAFDLRSGQCSGSFEVELGMASNDSLNIHVHGTFNIPVYD